MDEGGGNSESSETDACMVFILAGTVKAFKRLMDE